jgi:hypothetical protein
MHLKLAFFDGRGNNKRLGHWKLRLEQRLEYRKLRLKHRKLRWIDAGMHRMSSREALL